jgi:hypothetical protein
MSGSRWLPLLGGALLGLVLGVFYSWNVNPVEYVNSDPASLRESYREDYLVLIAVAYASTGDIERARARLSLFDLEQPEEQLAALAQKRLASLEDQEQARALARLAVELGTAVATAESPLTPSPTAPPSDTPPSVTATLRPRPSPLPSPSRTPGAPFEVLEAEQVCEPDLIPPLLQIVVLDADMEGIPGVEIRVLWEDGEDLFFTGLKPDIGPGYADFEMGEATTYAVQAAGSTFPVSDIVSETCQLESGEVYPGSVRLVFYQP